MDNRVCSLSGVGSVIFFSFSSSVSLQSFQQKPFDIPSPMCEFDAFDNCRAAGVGRKVK